MWILNSSHVLDASQLWGARPPCPVFPTITTSCLVPQPSAFHSIGIGSAVALSPHLAPIGLSHSTVFPCQLVPVPLDCRFEMFASTTVRQASSMRTICCSIAHRHCIANAMLPLVELRKTARCMIRVEAQPGWL